MGASEIVDGRLNIVFIKRVKTDQLKLLPVSASSDIKICLISWHWSDSPKNWQGGGGKVTSPVPTHILTTNHNLRSLNNNLFFFIFFNVSKCYCHYVCQSLLMDKYYNRTVFSSWYLEFFFSTFTQLRYLFICLNALMA